MRIHLIHGIRTEGPAPIEGLIPFLLPWKVAYPDYGWIEELETPFINRHVVGALKPYIEAEDVLIGHSNGCAIAYELMQQLPQVGGAVFVNAALERNITRPQACPWIHVYFNAGDQITELAAIAAKIGIVDKDWGDMGHGGYEGSDEKITNIDCGNQRNLPVVSGHSEFFAQQNLQAWGPALRAKLCARGIGG